MKRAAYLAILCSALGTSSGVVVKLGGSSGTPMVLLLVLAPYAYLLLIALFSQKQVVVRAIVVASVLVCISGLILYLTLYQRTQSMAGLIFFFVPMTQVVVLFLSLIHISEPTRPY